MPTQLDLQTAGADLAEMRPNEPMLAGPRPEIPGVPHKGAETVSVNLTETQVNMARLADTHPDLALLGDTSSSAGQRRPEPGPLKDAPAFRYASWKRLADLLVAFVLLLIASPVMLVCAVLVRLTLRGPAIYSQLRLGWNGRPFIIYKFRTMTHNCEKASGVRWSIPGDSLDHLVGSDPTPHSPGRISAIVERAQGRHEPGGPTP